MEKVERKKILFSSSTFRSVLLQWIEEKQKVDIDFNRKKIGEMLGFSSHSTMYDVLNGRRPFPYEKITLLKDVFNLSQEEVEYLQLLHRLEKSSSEEQCANIYEEMKNIAQYSGFHYCTLSDQLKNNIFAMQVFAAFGLFDGAPTFENLLSFFGRNRILDLEHAIHLLFSEGIITRENKRFVSKNSESLEVSFKPSTKDLLRESLLMTATDVDTIIDKSDSFVIHKVIPCKKSDLEKNIIKFRKEIFKLMIKCEVRNGDVLLKLISACYPVYSPIDKQD